MTWSGRCLALPTLGRSTTPVVISGAVTMKMISSTSITSMNGTMLISLIERRRLLRATTAGMAGQFSGAGAVAAGPVIGAPTLRCRMLRNSSMKVSSCVAMRSMSRAKRL